MDVKIDPRSLSSRSIASVENLNRQKSKLRRCSAAITYLRELGLNDETIEKFHLGIREPFKKSGEHQTVTNALVFPVIGRDGNPIGRYMMFNIPGVTKNPISQGGWCVGRPITTWSGNAVAAEILIVVEDCSDLWLIDQNLTIKGFASDIVLICSSRRNLVPQEWLDPKFWEGWSLVFFAHTTEVAVRAAQKLLRVIGHEFRLLKVPDGYGQSWGDFFREGGTVEDFINQLDGSSSTGDTSPARETADESKLLIEGEYEALPVNINGAYVGGHLYYPVTVEYRAIERVKNKYGSHEEQEVTCYKTKVIRSDGAMLDIQLLPAPHGTPRNRRVLALTDGTRIDHEPQPSNHASWHLDSIKSYVNSMRMGLPAPHRPLRELIAETERHLRHAVWLPTQEDYAILSLYVALSYVYQVFPAIPLLLVVGEKGSGKSELGEAMAAASFNAFIIGQGSAASLVRLLNDTKGLAVIDDVESLSRAMEKNFSDLNQMLKLSYKKQTGRKTITLNNGKTVTYDFYGPKVINNTRGVDPILGSRMLHIRTQVIPTSLRPERQITKDTRVDLLALRNEFHAWGMANANKVAEMYKTIATETWDRSKEIAAPLHTIAFATEDREYMERLETALRSQSAPDLSPIEILIQAATNCVLKGAHTCLSAAQLVLEIRLLSKLCQSQNSGDRPLWLQSEWIGQQLKILGIRDPKMSVSRSRLYGRLTRIYYLNCEFVNEVIEARTVEVVEANEASDDRQNSTRAFDFCVQRETCILCPYQEICTSTLDGLRIAKEKKRRISSTSPC